MTDQEISICRQYLENISQEYNAIVQTRQSYEYVLKNEDLVTYINGTRGGEDFNQRLTNLFKALETLTTNIRAKISETQNLLDEVAQANSKSVQ